MAPDCVLLDRYVTFLDDPALASDEIAGGVRAAANPQDLRDGIAAYLRAMKLRAQVENPPRITYLSMVRPLLSDPLVPQFGRQIDSGVVAAAGDNFVVLYAGPYLPASSSMGCYLVYDAAAPRSSSPPLSTVPGVPYSASHSSHPATVGGFVLAELLIRFRPAPTVGDVCVWSPSSSSSPHGGGGRWVHNSGRLPAQLLPPAHTFRAHHGLLLPEQKHR
uniref:Uncharacterized protein n=1 Tax=Oryza punctata TaxID=4537 RepID=A0A0E0M9M4_ORYPU